MNPYLILGAVLAAIAIAWGAYWKGSHDGRNDERVEWQAKDNSELADANAWIQRLEDEARTSERVHAEEQAEIQATYQRRLKDEKLKAEKLVADARSGALQLRDPGAAAERACPGGASETPASAGRRDGAAAGELPAEAAGILSKEASAFLLDLTAEADAIVEQLTACQAIIGADRR